MQENQQDCKDLALSSDGFDQYRIQKVNLPSSSAENLTD
jgi:hypothetical protein